MATRKPSLHAGDVQARVHSPHQAGYRGAEKDGELRVTCLVCAAEPHPDYSSRLSTAEPRPDAAELDDAPYAGIGAVFISRAVER
jgi:hypothetical protein